MYALVFVLDDPDRLDEVLTAWADIGVRGVTIIESTGWQRRRIQQSMLGARFDFASLAGGARLENHMTLFVVVENRDIVKKALETVESIVGDLDEPDTGILVAWPVEILKGLPDEEETRG
jgi:nitrogen regulatory protein PII